MLCRAWAVGSLTLLFLQSVTWSSGLMFLSAPSLLLAYLFSSLNTAQGLLITILHCTLARKVGLTSHNVPITVSVSHHFLWVWPVVYMIKCRVRRIMAGACDCRSAVRLPHPTLQTLWRVPRFDPTAATPAARVAEPLLTDRCARVHTDSVCLCLSLFLTEGDISCFRVVSEGCGMTQFADRLNPLLLPQMLTTLLPLTEVMFIAFKISDASLLWMRKC